MRLSATVILAIVASVGVNAGRVRGRARLAAKPSGATSQHRSAHVPVTNELHPSGFDPNLVITDQDAERARAANLPVHMMHKQVLYKPREAQPARQTPASEDSERTWTAQNMQRQVSAENDSKTESQFSSDPVDNAVVGDDATSGKRLSGLVDEQLPPKKRRFQ
jgi:hypothetical protein